MPRDETPLVYSTDGAHRALCPTCGRHPCICPEQAAVVPSETVLRMRLEKKGRGGKAVTVVFDLPQAPHYFAGVFKRLKSHCGAGGAMKDGRMEIQGDQRDKVQAFLQQQGFMVRRAGG